MADPKTIDEAYERYKTGKGFGRQDLFAFMIKDMKELQQRIGSVDEERVQELAERLTALETTLGNALRPPMKVDVTPKSKAKTRETA